jgi:hypothetical protein
MHVSNTIDVLWDGCSIEEIYRRFISDLDTSLRKFRLDLHSTLLRGIESFESSFIHRLSTPTLQSHRSKRVDFVPGSVSGLLTSILIQLLVRRASKPLQSLQQSPGM